MAKATRDTRVEKIEKVVTEDKIIEEVVLKLTVEEAQFLRDLFGQVFMSYTDKSTSLSNSIYNSLQDIGFKQTYSVSVDNNTYGFYLKDKK